MITKILRFTLEQARVTSYLQRHKYHYKSVTKNASGCDNQYELANVTIAFGGGVEFAIETIESAIYMTRFFLIGKNKTPNRALCD